MDDIHIIADLISEDPDFSPRRMPISIIQLCSRPDHKHILNTIRTIARKSEDKDNRLKLLIDGNINMMEIVNAVRNGQCISIPGTDRDAGSTYLEQQIGGIITTFGWANPQLICPFFLKYSPFSKRTKRNRLPRPGEP